MKLTAEVTLQIKTARDEPKMNNLHILGATQLVVVLLFLCKPFRQHENP